MMRLIAGLAGLCLLAFLGLFAAVCICARLPRKAGRGDVLLVLGAKVRPDGTLSHSLQRRCETAMQAWRNGCAPKLLLCGGICAGDPGPEAEYMRAFLLERGVPPEALMLETRSSNTVENLKNARRIMEANGMERALLVTSDYHLTRALWIARDQGVTACGIGAPSPGRLRFRLKARLRETVSWILYFYYRINRNGRLS